MVLPSDSGHTHTDFFSLDLLIILVMQMRVRIGTIYFKNLKNKKVTITDTRISYSDDDSKIVMDVDPTIDGILPNIVTQNGGKVLDVGFGDIVIDNRSYNKVGNYHCIETNPQIFNDILGNGSKVKIMFIYI